MSQPIERGASGLEIGELQQRLSDLGYDVTVDNDYGEYTEEAVKRFQEWLGAEATGVCDPDTMAQLEYHVGQSTPEPAAPVETPADEVQYSEDGQYYWDGAEWKRVDGLEQVIGYAHTSDEEGEHYFAGFSKIENDETGTEIVSLGLQVDVSDTGVHAEAAGGSFDIQSQDGYGVQASGFTAEAEAVWNNQGYYGVGAQATVVEVGGNYGSPQGDVATADDVFVRGAVNEGVGAAGRVYGGTDVDGDGVREYGLGVDYGPAGGDIRIESQWATEAHQTASETYDAAAQTASETYDAAAQYAGETYDSAAQTASETYDSAAQTASETYDAAAQTASETYDAAAEAVSGIFSSDDEKTTR
jgi:peptidoglycan hydrolase-like protein with peptidoglycan-binding domain